MTLPIEDVIDHQRKRLHDEPAQNLYIHRDTLARLLDAAEGKKES